LIIFVTKKKGNSAKKGGNMLFVILGFIIGFLLLDRSDKKSGSNSDFIGTGLSCLIGISFGIPYGLL